MNTKQYLTVKKLRIYAMAMRMLEIEQQRINSIIVVGDDFTKVAAKTEVFKIKNTRELTAEPIVIKQKFTELPQNTKHLKKRKFHN
jgi:hypothetical protein